MKLQDNDLVKTVYLAEVSEEWMSCAVNWLMSPSCPEMTILRENEYQGEHKRILNLPLL